MLRLLFISLLLSIISIPVIAGESNIFHTRKGVCTELPFAHGDLHFCAREDLPETEYYFQIALSSRKPLHFSDVEIKVGKLSKKKPLMHFNNYRKSFTHFKSNLRIILSADDPLLQAIRDGHEATIKFKADEKHYNISFDKVRGDDIRMVSLYEKITLKP